MLQETVDRNTIKKRVAVCTASAVLNQVLERLLPHWGFTLCRPEDPSALFLVEDGCGVPAAGQDALWLSFSHKSEQGRLGLPVTIESLWQALEQHFHFPPRMYMRKAVDLPARVSMRGEWHETRLSSLSCMGTRFSSDREMVKQEQVIFELATCGVMRQYHGQVIFSMAEGPEEVPVFQSGVVFQKQGDVLHDDLRYYLIRQYLEAVREGMELQAFQAGLAFFDLMPEVRRSLLESD